MDVRTPPPRARAAGALAALLCAALAPAHAGTSCAQTLLMDLGWRFVRAGDVASPRIEAGAPCTRANLAQAHAAGDLRVLLPTAMDAGALVRLNESLLAHPATTCAYAFGLGEATRRAVDRLVANDGYRFTALQLGWIGFGAGGAARDGWRPIASFGRGYVPRDGNWRAIEGFYTGHVRAECGVGRQVAQYATQAELYGPEGFDAAFDAGEIVIGRWRVLNASGGVLQGAAAGELVRDGDARKASARGRQALVGVPGFITHDYARRYLDDVNNQAQNFVVYDVSPAAAESLRGQGGFEAFNSMAGSLWRLSQSFAQMRPPHYFQQLLLERDAALRAALDDRQRAVAARMDAILAEPFFSGFRIYVHRQGVRPVGDHFVRMLDRNPRTPFHIAFALHNVHTTLRDRYFAYRLAACAGGAGGVR